MQCRGQSVPASCVMAAFLEAYAPSTTEDTRNVAPNHLVYCASVCIISLQCAQVAHVVGAHGLASIRPLHLSLATLEPIHIIPSCPWTLNLLNTVLAQFQHHTAVMQPTLVRMPFKRSNKRASKKGVQQTQALPSQSQPCEPRTSPAFRAADNLSFPSWTSPLACSCCQAESPSATADAGGSTARG